jgi:hypothetical protein
MLFNPAHARRFDWRTSRVRLVSASTLDLSASISRVSQSCKADTQKRIDQLTEVGAWTDATLALIEYELSGWQLRRLAYEDGEWFCSLSQHPYVPCDLDDTADARHEIAALAILNAHLEARGRAATESRTSLPPALRIRPTPDCVVCCDNFA